MNIKTLVATGMMAAAAATGATAASAATPALPTGCVQQVETQPAGSPVDTYAAAAIDPGTASADMYRGTGGSLSCPSTVTMHGGQTKITFGSDTTTQITRTNGNPLDYQPNSATFENGTLHLSGSVNVGLAPFIGEEIISPDGSMQFNVGDWQMHLSPDGTPTATSNVTADKPSSVQVSPDGAFILHGSNSDSVTMLKPWIVQGDYR